MLIFFIVLAGLSVLIVGHEAGHFFVAKLFGLRIDEFGFGFPPRIWAWRPKRRFRESETEYSFNWLPFGGFVKIAGENDKVAEAEKLERVGDAEKKRFFAFRSAAVRSCVILAGVAMNFLIGWALFTLVLLIGAPKAVVIAGIEPGSPAAAAGFLSGDVVNGFEDTKTLTDFIQAHKGEPITLTVIRGAKDQAITAVPRTDAGPNQGALGVILAEAGEERRGFPAAVIEGFRRAVQVCWFTLKAFYALAHDLFTQGTLLEGVVGPVGIFSVAQETGQVGFVYLLQLLGIISLNLTVVNLIPFPALDGGRFVLILAEKMRGSPIPRRVEAAINAIGFAFLIALMALLTIRDVWGLL